MDLWSGCTLRCLYACTGRKDIKLVSLKVAGKEHTDYDVTEKQLTLSKLPQGEFEVEIDVDIKPQVRRRPSSRGSHNSLMKHGHAPGVALQHLCPLVWPHQEGTRCNFQH